eukprot:scaffold88184_cov31-Tisochrysis_lutea.AAC.2
MATIGQGVKLVVFDVDHDGLPRRLDQAAYRPGGLTGRAGYGERVHHESFRHEACAGEQETCARKRVRWAGSGWRARGEARSHVAALRCSGPPFSLTHHAARRRRAPPEWP